MASLCSQSSLDKDESMRVSKFTRINKQEKDSRSFRPGFVTGIEVDQTGTSVTASGLVCASRSTAEDQYPTNPPRLRHIYSSGETT